MACVFVAMDRDGVIRGFQYEPIWNATHGRWESRAGCMDFGFIQRSPERGTWHDAWIRKVLQLKPEEVVCLYGDNKPMYGKVVVLHSIQWGVRKE